MKRIDVIKTGDGWAGKSRGRTVPGTKAGTKAEAVAQTAAVARAGSQPVTVKIHKETGRIQEERTYPRSADSRGRRG